MRFDVLTLFPQIIYAVLGESITGRAVENGLLEINAINIRDFSSNKHKKVDDYPYGGGSGMVMGPQPIYDAWKSLTVKLEYRPRTIYMSPQGRVLTQEYAKRLKEENEHIIILCGHYEGIDERIIEEIVDEEISIGDYVLTGGEIPAVTLIDCVSRMIPGVLSSDEAYSQESIYNGLLEYPQYTRPQTFLDKDVPEVLLSGHHANIDIWRRQQSILRTYNKRADLLDFANLSEKEKKWLESLKI